MRNVNGRRELQYIAGSSTRGHTDTNYRELLTTLSLFSLSTARLEVRHHRARTSVDFINASNYDTAIKSLHTVRMVVTIGVIGH